MCIRDRRWEVENTADADLLIVAFGTVGRIARSAMRQARARGLRVGIFRPISLWPFPYDALRAAASRTRGVLVVEMNAGQMLEDVRLALGERKPIQFLGRMGGIIPLPDEILAELQKMAGHGDSHSTGRNGHGHADALGAIPRQTTL